MNAVEISNVKFCYSQKVILDDINVKVPYGKIYSLLGPSGAGKTTLLRLILGRIKPSSGVITVLQDKPGVKNRLIGYMPQDQALCKTFTVRETLRYFANIFRLSSYEFKSRVRELKRMLGLPNESLQISELSGGQQKIVSLSITFLQHPKLMILDEPTVGSDPMLGDYIWRYLHLLCERENIVIILVTHYIEEATKAHLTGIMRDGRMLEEGTPNNLINRYQQTTLEEVFLHLCLRGKSKDFMPSDEFFEENAQKSIDPKMEILQKKSIESDPNQSNLLLDFWILLVLMHKNLSKFFQFNITMLIFLVPAFQALILGLMYDVDSVAIPIAVSNDEIEPYYSNMILNSIKKVDVYYLKPIKYGSLDLALDALKQAKVTGVIRFEPNFTESLSTRIVQSELLDNETLASSSVKVWIDNTNFIYANGFLDSLRQTIYYFLDRIRTEQNTSRFEAPIRLSEIIYAEDSKLSDFLLPGYLIAFIYLSQVTITSQLLIQERKEGLFERSLVAGCSHSIILLSHFFSSIILAIIQIALMLFVSLYIFDIINYGPIWLVFVSVFAQALSAIATGLFVSSIVQEGSTATLISIFITFSQLFTSGTIFPKEFVRLNVQPFVFLSPIALPAESLRNVMLRSWQIDHPYVYNGLLVNLVSMFLLLLCTSFIFKRNS
ncbi:ABC transporter G family member 20 [Sarcoptes scabiei]|uniref:ABC transporter G family member 20 n=1 Tax=Sarcoptes scabiei TaxID=52283 RepID=A0A834R4A0_SARSC|nr:ABC transporter G family member 20 [Sarcoptes scabiei]